MKYSRLGTFRLSSDAFVLHLRACWAQKGESYSDMATPQVRSDKLGMPEHLRNYVVDGKLKLSLRDAVVLTLENNSFVRMQETQVESSKFTLLGAHAPFDPVVTPYYSVNSSSSHHSANCKEPADRVHLQLARRKMPSSTTRKHSRPARTYRQGWAATTISPTTRFTFLTLMSLRH